MIELEVKQGPKTGLETVQNGEHAVVEVASYDDLKQSPLVRVTDCILDCIICDCIIVYYAGTYL